MKIRVSILAILLLSSITLPAQSNSDSTHTFLSPQEFKTAFTAETKAQLIDVRTPDEFKKSHLPDAININYYDPQFWANLDKIDKGQVAYIYCSTGGRSKGTVAALKQKGYTNVYALNGFYADLAVLFNIKVPEAKRPNANQPIRK